jgi:hypothetical protein
MLWIFKALSDRIKALFVTDVAAGLEAQFVAREAERKAILLRQAQAYEDEGLKGIAQQIRQQTEALSAQRPLASVLPAIEHFHSTEKGLFLEEDENAVALLPAPAPVSAPVAASLPSLEPAINKKKRR